MTPERHFRVVHGHRRGYVLTGSGPALLLIHGIGDSATTWADVLPLLAEHFTVIAPDLLGHGESDKPRADYSLGGFANAMRDLLLLLGIETATVVGHSLGGGVALQFAYQYPQMCERLVLVASGGLGAEVTPLLRAAALPGAGPAIALATGPLLRAPLQAGLQLAGWLGLLGAADAAELARVCLGLRDSSTRAAFLRTLRAVVDVRGQSVTSRDRLYLTAAIPLLLIWGERDPVLPVGHARAAVRDLPQARLVVLPWAGHLPHQTSPAAFADEVRDFVHSTAPAVHDADRWRALLDGS